MYLDIEGKAEGAAPGALTMRTKHKLFYLIPYSLLCFFRVLTLFSCDWWQFTSDKVHAAKR